MASSDHTPTKRCSKCKNEYPATTEYFSVRSDDPAKFQSWCKHCKSVVYGHVPKEKLPTGQKRCKCCKQLKLLNEFHRYNRSADGYRYTCKECRASKEGFRYKLPTKGGFRRCCACQQEYPATSDYFFAKSKRGNLQSECKSCYQKRIRQHARRHPEWNAASSHKRRARIKANGGTFTSADVRLQLKSQKGRCWWCGKPHGKKYHVDHVIPLARGGANSASNIVISCPRCNASKGAKLPSEWMGRLL